ncbi:MAG: hypothetical protein HY367_01970 [Candidatus Aenigmarchaeota archaeon]|nr:hypothetical protein [Candidatus Aenigmarchaeota archaeon]
MMPQNLAFPVVAVAGLIVAAALIALPGIQTAEGNECFTETECALSQYCFIGYGPTIEVTRGTCVNQLPEGCSTIECSYFGPAGQDKRTEGQLPANTGINGSVTSVFCPGVEGRPCTSSGIESTIIVRTTGATPEEVARMETDQDGNFLIPLQPGTYYVEAVPKYPCSPPSSSNNLVKSNVKVVEGSFTYTSMGCFSAAP